MLIGVVLLSVVAFVARDHFTQRENTTVDLVFRVVVLILGVGSIYWRRRYLSAARLEAVAATGGKIGLISYLERSTLKVAMLGDAIAFLGFITTVITGNELYTYWAGVIALIVLVFHYPRKSLWVQTVENFSKQL